VEGAKKEGELLLYSSWSVQEAEKMFNKFQEKYPFIKAVLYRGTSESLLTRIVAEDRSKKYLFDVVSLPTLTIEVLKRANIIGKYISPQEKYFPEIFKDSEGYWIAAYYMLNVMAYNTKLVAPRTSPNLRRPSRGQVERQYRDGQGSLLLVCRCRQNHG